MPEIKDGSILAISTIEGNNFTFNGKPIKFEQDKNSPTLYTARTQLSKQEKDAGNLETALTFSVGDATGIISAVTCPPETEDFKDLTDSEKITKLNSIAYQHNTIEPTDVGVGLDGVLQKSYSGDETVRPAATSTTTAAATSTSSNDKQPCEEKSEPKKAINLPEIKASDENTKPKQPTSNKK